jgi:hypothetical protein
MEATKRATVAQKVWRSNASGKGEGKAKESSLASGPRSADVVRKCPMTIDRRVGNGTGEERRYSRKCPRGEWKEREARSGTLVRFGNTLALTQSSARTGANHSVELARSHRCSTPVKGCTINHQTPQHGGQVIFWRRRERGGGGS